MFLDKITITVSSGRGGNGCESYLHRTDHKKIPNGGDGGNGGDVIVRADKNTGSLLSLRAAPTFEAEAGENGAANRRYGRKGKESVIKVPCGTTIYSLPDRLLIRDLLNDGDEVVVVKGGQGGYGNHADKPRTKGEAGKEIQLFFSFKIIADIFLVGLPGTGKTTFLKYLTQANVSAGTYPFSTKNPQLGTYQSDHGDLQVCDLPSVYGGSGAGRGLGNHFLKHLERARLLFLILDPVSEFSKDLTEGVKILLTVLGEANPDYLSIPRFWIVNKIDKIKKKNDLEGGFPEEELDRIFPISSLTGEGVAHLMKRAVSELSRRGLCAKN